MATWKNLDTLETFKALSEVKRVKLAEAMSGAEGAERVKKYSVPMAEGFSYNFAAKQVDDEVLNALKALAEEAQLAEKFEELYNGAVINTGENRLVLHQLTRGQLGNAVEADGVDKREFYVKQQARIAEFANKVHNGEITNAAGEKFTTVVQIGIGGSDLGPRAMYLALENWAKKNDTFKMEAKFIRTRSSGGERPGTGDVFSSVVAGALLNGKSLPEAVAQAAGFVKECIKVSDEEQIPHANGVCFEKILGKLIKK